MFPQKITIMKISIMYADFSYIVRERWPTVFGMKKWYRKKCFHTY